MTSRIDVIVQKMRENSSNIRFVDACKVAESYFGKPRQNATSHKVYRMPWSGDPRINLQKGKSGKAKDYQVRQLIKAIDRLDSDCAKKRSH